MNTMISTRAKSLSSSLLALAIVGLALTGCAAGSAPTPDPTESGLPHTESTAPPFGGQQGEIPAQEDILNVPDLRNTVLLVDCAATDDGWAATGTAENTSDADASYRIVVFYTDAQARAVTSSTIDVAVAAGETEQWEAPAVFTADAGTMCVLAGVGNTP